jgi:hypothetical protein
VKLKRHEYHSCTEWLDAAVSLVVAVAVAVAVVVLRIEAVVLVSKIYSWETCALRSGIVTHILRMSLIFVLIYCSYVQICCYCIQTNTNTMFKAVTLQTDILQKVCGQNCKYIYIYTHVCVCACVCMKECICVCMFVSVRKYACMYACTPRTHYVCIYVCMCACVRACRFLNVTPVFRSPIASTVCIYLFDKSMK